MRYLVAFLQVLGLYIKTALSSTVGRCAAANTKFENTTCIVFNNKDPAKTFYEIDATRCNSSYYCPGELNAQRNYECTRKVDPFSGYDGSFCNLDKDCHSNACDKSTNKCIGKKAGFNCTEDDECANGFYCDTTCVPLLGEKKACNLETHGDFQCDYNLGCYNGFCTQYYSLDDGATVSNLRNEKKFCKSGFSLANAEGPNGTCVTSKLIGDEKCANLTATCQYSYSLPGASSKTYTRSCAQSLAYSDTETKFCPVGSETILKNFVPNIKAHYNSKEVRNRHSKNRDVLSGDLNFDHFYYSESPLYKDVDKCVKQLFTSSSFTSLSIILVLLLGLILA